MKLVMYLNVDSLVMNITEKQTNKQTDTWLILMSKKKWKKSMQNGQLSNFFFIIVIIDW